MYDVIVAGAGLAGCCAAISSARQGLKVLLIERYGFPGGMATVGLVNPFMPYGTYDVAGKYISVNDMGIFSEILKNLSDRNGLLENYFDKRKNVWGGKEVPHENRHTFNEEVLKIILDEMLDAAGVTVLYHSFVFEAETVNRNINTIKTIGKSGSLKHKARFFIDATGDADLSSIAGCRTEIGREDGKCQPMTLCFRIGNADPVIAREIIHDKQARDRINEKYNMLQNKGLIENKRENVLIFPHVANGAIHFNSTRLTGLNPLDPFDLTKAEKTARKQVNELLEFFKEHVPGFEKSILLQTAPQIGIRESRRIVGLYRLSETDLINCTKFSDSIARGCYPIDIHNPDGSGTRITEIPPGEYYTIPYRCIVPEDMDNLLVAGRPVSSSHEAHAAIRIMPICANIGEVAGLAASACIKHNKKAAELDISLSFDKLSSG